MQINATHTTAVVWHTKQILLPACDYGTTNTCHEGYYHDL